MAARVAERSAAHAADVEAYQTAVSSGRMQTAGGLVALGASPNEPNNAAHIGGEVGSSPEKAAQTSSARKPRIVSVDVLRGITMSVMVLVDVSGGAWPGIGHDKWNGVHLADFVMPYFLFLVGVSLAMVVKEPLAGRRIGLFRKALWRSVKLFAVGVFIQGGWLWGDQNPPGLDLKTFRVMGILQRIAIAFLICAAVKLFVPALPILSPEEREAAVIVEPGDALGALAAPPSLVVASAAARQGGGGLSTQRRCSTVLDLWLFQKYALQWTVSLLFLAAYLVIVHGVAAPGKACSAGDWVQGPPHLSGCNVAGWLDEKILGRQHFFLQDNDLYGDFDPEGVITTLGCIFTVYCGVHAGHAMVALRPLGRKGEARMLLHWAVTLALPALVIAVPLHATGAVPFNKRMWSLSYNLLMVGTASLMLGFLYLVFDRLGSSGAGLFFQARQGDADLQDRPLLLPGGGATAETRRGAGSRVAGAVLNVSSSSLAVLLRPFQWLGANAILYFMLSDSGGILELLVKSLTVGSKENNLATFFKGTILMDWFGFSCPGYADQTGMRHAKQDECVMILAYSVSQILFWMLVCGVLYRKKIFLRL